MTGSREHVLVVGASARALAESAARAGYPVSAVDAFGDLDTSRVARRSLAARDLGLRYAPLAIARLAQHLEADALAYGGGWENHPRAIRVAARGRQLLGNPPAVLTRVRDPLALAQLARRRGFPAPTTLDRPPVGGERERVWLVKPRRSAGGRAIAPWSPAAALSAAEYLQEYIAGVPASLSFAATPDGRVLPFALSRQLIGEAAFGADGFRYCGSILSTEFDPQLPSASGLLHAASALARAVATTYRLVGVNGIDFIARAGAPWVVEVNPRYSASMELAERAQDVSVFDLHVRACRAAVHETFEPFASAGAGAYGKAVVYARCTVRIGDSRAWLEDDDMRDIPRPGERIERGQPVCTIFARGNDAAACHAALVQRAARVHAEIELQARPAA